MMVEIVGIMEDLEFSEKNVLCDYVEAFGLAYQIMDDVRDLDGSLAGKKENFEDIRQGKITLPLIKAVELSSPEIREKMKIVWQRSDKSTEDIHLLAQWIISSGALDICKKEAFELLDKAWIQVDRLFPDSHYKLMIRAMSNHFLNKV